jgi:hypothetical protein
MSGNTKLLGFLPNNQVQLERWGVKASVDICNDCTTQLKELCISLPKKPNQKISPSKMEFKSEYEDSSGRILVSMTPDCTRYLADLLDVLVKSDVRAMDKVRPWVEDLEKSIAEHTLYHDTSEPGVP